MPRTENRSLGVVQVMDNSVLAINDALRQIQQRIDYLRGLQGRVEVFDRVRADPPEQVEDVLTLGSAQESFVTVGDDQDITGKKTFRGDSQFDGHVEFNGDVDFNDGDITLHEPATLRYLDASNELIHAWATDE